MEHENNSDQQDPTQYVREVTARYIGPRRKSVVISSHDVASDFMRRLLRDHAREHFFALYLDGAHRVASYSVVSLGTANTTVVHPREVFQGAILVGAVAVIVGHNHPSGELVASREDIVVTKTLKDAGSLIGIKLLDHIILTPDAHVSLRDGGHLD